MTYIENIIELALNHQRNGKIKRAKYLYNKILEIDPKNSDAIHLLGMIEYSNHNYTLAINCIEKAIKLNPDIPDYHINLTSCYIATLNLVKAKQHALIAIDLDHNLFKAYYNLGNILFAEGDIEGAIINYKKALNIKSDNQSIWSNYLFALNFLVGSNPESIFLENRKWGQQIENKIKKHRKPFINRNRNHLRKIAYYLPEMDSHVTPRFIRPLLLNHDRTKFEILGYGYQQNNSKENQQFIDQFTFWLDIKNLSTEKLVERMREDKIDILIHPCTFKSRYREILAHRPAPIQVANTNLVSTTGLKEVDFLVTDSTISPKETSLNLYTEKLIYLSQVNTYQALENSPNVSELPALKNNYITFGSCNNIAKINIEVIKTWSRILNAIPNSKLLIKHRSLDNNLLKRRILFSFREFDIESERIVLEGFTPNPIDYLDVYNKIDISLDPFPFGGGTVSYESLWMGVPILTMLGELFMGRLSGSLMKQVGLSNWIVNSQSDYISIAISFSTNLGELGQIRQTLRQQARLSIFDGVKYTREFESALIKVWGNYIKNQKTGI